MSFLCPNADSLSKQKRQKARSMGQIDAYEKAGSNQCVGSGGNDRSDRAQLG